jgi:predicted RNA binding protein YcfA (HicA-like mRNA interferase family)
MLLEVNYEAEVEKILTGLGFYVRISVGKHQSFRG